MGEIPPEPLPGHLVAGLGNPGPRYAFTRHNMGFLVVDRLWERWSAGPWREACLSRVAEARFGDAQVFLAQPQTYMNRSGDGVIRLAARIRVPPERLIVVHDDIDLPYGRLRVRTGGGHGGHKGIRSILATLGAVDFTRLKIGIGRPTGHEDVTEHVLGPFGKDEEAVLPDLLDRAAEAVEHIVLEGPLGAMNRVHN